MVRLDLFMACLMIRSWLLGFGLVLWEERMCLAIGWWLFPCCCRCYGEWWVDAHVHIISWTLCRWSLLLWCCSLMLCIVVHMMHVAICCLVGYVALNVDWFIMFLSTTDMRGMYVCWYALFFSHVEISCSIMCASLLSTLSDGIDLFPLMSKGES